MIDIISIVTNKRLNELDRLVESISHQTHSHLISKLIICINPSDGMNIELKTNLKVIQLHQDVGSPASARNYAISKSDQKYVLLLDSDVELSSDWINNIYNYLESNPVLVAAQGLVLPDQKNTLGNFKFHYKKARTNNSMVLAYNHIRIVPILDTASLMIRRDLFDELKFKPYFKRQEDLMFSDDLFSKGYPFGILTSSIAYKSCMESLYEFCKNVLLDGIYIKKFERSIGRKVPRMHEWSHEFLKIKNFQGGKHLYALYLIFLGIGFLFERLVSNKGLEILEHDKKYSFSKYLFSFLKAKNYCLNPLSRFIRIDNIFIFNNFHNLIDLDSFNNQELSEEHSEVLERVLIEDSVVSTDKIKELVRMNILLEQ